MASHMKPASASKTTAQPKVQAHAAPDTQKSQPTPGAPDKKPSRRRHLLWAIPAGALVLLGAAYVGGALYFQTTFLPGTTLDGQDVSLRPVSEVAAEKSASLDGFETHVTGMGLDLTVTAEQAGLSCDGDAYVRLLVLEKLDFRYGGMSHRMNRLITRTGRACLKQRLQALTEKHGIQVTLVPPQYTSQECSGCGYVNKRNRKDRSHFNCRFCNKKLHADINASRVVKSRSSWQQPDNTGPQSRRNTFRMLDQRFRQRWHLKPTQGTDADVTGAPRVAQTASANGAGRENGICE